MRAVASAAFLLGLMGAAAEIAQTPAVDPAAARKLRVACGADIKAFCADVQPGGGRIMQCFRAHVRELQPDCRSALRAMRNTPAPASGEPAPSSTPYPRD